MGETGKDASLDDTVHQSTLGRPARIRSLDHPAHGRRYEIKRKAPATYSETHAEHFHGGAPDTFSFDLSGSSANETGTGIRVLVEVPGFSLIFPAIHCFIPPRYL